MTERLKCALCQQAFVAMWFHDGMSGTYERGIKPAPEACNYRPYVVNQEPSDNGIDDEIVANVRKSRLLVADLTGCRPSVFYEAGFAHGLRIPLVLTCNRGQVVRYGQVAPDGASAAEREGTWFEHVEKHGFDLRNHYILGWSTHEELAKALKDNIVARGLDLPPRRP